MLPMVAATVEPCRMERMVRSSSLHHGICILRQCNKLVRSAVITQLISIDGFMDHDWRTEACRTLRHTAKRDKL